eukprot:TRINITY_DN1570_c0_g1_i1.p1 TRINITY_DN1570_c0_g1~~TRINITY_DN1570_c0_g1_i1.p1  ORF type:complete len:512 (+),score=159.44 TRINITY_DN1570_c0_g1_i1:98-1633(+)
MNPLKPKAVVSLHVASMLQSSQLISAVLKEIGYDVWVCSDMSGTEYREEIDRNITKADVVVIVLNGHWANSMECKREFNVAQQAHFTNLEINGNNRPVIMPIAFSDFNWFSDHPLFSVKNTNFICHNSTNLLSGSIQDTLDKFKASATQALFQLIVKEQPTSGQNQANFGLDLMNLYGSTEVVESGNRNMGTTNIVPENRTGDDEYSQAIKYENGTGVTKDMSMAAQLFEKASAYGHLEATYKLGVCYDFGEGVEEDEEKAVKLYEIASLRGHLDATYNLGICYAAGTGVKKDDVKAAQLYDKAASQGHLNALYNLGGCYKKGKGVKMDMQKAVDIYQRAASLGHMKAACNLGSSYTTGAGVKKDNKKAIELYEKAASQGVSEATYNLGLCYEQGRGVKKDKKRAVRFFETASSQGHLNAICRLGYCYMNGKGAEKDMRRGAELFEKAASQGSLYGAYHLGRAYEKGNGKTRDIEKAKDLYTRAAAKGDKSSRNRLYKLSFKRQTERFISL